HIPLSQIPEKILTFIETYFPGSAIKEAERENNGNYEIELENKIELIFDADGNFLGQGEDENENEDDINIDPADLPQNILDYIAENYPNNTIIEAEIEDDGNYEVTLNNGVELEFDSQGHFLSA
ncbi:PepSY-like domain-containing protein, partial [Christiangramia aquimixticola]|uniref:PepSY-like domain-containing protein n=1 Tax=Christiangramia aquimixticola TaxID=1697558 RepID=UPI003AA8EE18